MVTVLVQINFEHVERKVKIIQIACTVHKINPYGEMCCELRDIYGTGTIFSLNTSNLESEAVRS